MMMMMEWKEMVMMAVMTIRGRIKIRRGIVVMMWTRGIIIEMIMIMIVMTRRVMLIAMIMLKILVMIIITIMLMI